MGNLVLACSHELWLVESPFGKGLRKVEQKKYTLFQRLDGSLVSYFVSFIPAFGLRFCNLKYHNIWATCLESQSSSMGKST
jgi:hypothetical protein